MINVKPFLTRDVRQISLTLISFSNPIDRRSSHCPFFSHFSLFLSHLFLSFSLSLAFFFLLSPCIHSLMQLIQCNTYSVICNVMGSPSSHHKKRFEIQVIFRKFSSYETTSDDTRHHFPSICQFSHFLRNFFLNRKLS